MESQQLKVLRRKFIEKVIEDFGEAYLPIQKNDFESINLSALVGAILKKNRAKIPEYKLKEFLVSEQTLRRIFEERDKETTFQQTTRNFLSLYIGFQNYPDFLENTDFSDKAPQGTLHWGTSNWRLIGITVLVMSLLITIGFVWRNKFVNPSIKGKITKVILESNEAPITVRFNYKFNHLDFKRAILDYRILGNKDTIEIDKTKQSASVCFMHPTVRTIRLVADGKVLDSTKVIIPSNGWVAGYEEVHYLPPHQWKKNGVAHISKDDLLDNIREQSIYYSFIKKVGNFDKKLSCDEMVFETRLKNPISEGGISCNDISIVFTGEKHKFLLNLTQKGCSHYAYVRFSNKIIEGKSNNLSKLGINLDEFVRLRIILKDKKLQIYTDDQLIFQTNYTDNLGKMQAAYIGFKGLGSVDYVKIFSEKKVVEWEDF